ncbi:MAG: nucleotidyl transferase AbiEii/AbiGii toxin family protein [Candidatus Peribacteria bacterium]|jgi:predicted nucleotidyltransferase component of viral defense system|nr:nucleotidyl transferase AbiEii/AbiGii toxin family protein [Candidatus Peribacteria bacterium]
MLNISTHEKYMRTILKSIFSDEIGEFLAFKGGTLAYFCFGLDRFSTDIDIDVLDLNQEQLILERMRTLLLDIGETKNETLGKNLHRRIFRYDERSMNIKVELNKRNLNNNDYEFQTIEGVSLRCMTRETAVANKLLALSERFYNRDMYDVYYFFKHKFPFKEEIIYERSGISTPKFIKKLISELPKYFTENSVLAGLGDVLTDQQKARVKPHLLNETIVVLKQYLEGIR